MGDIHWIFATWTLTWEHHQWGLMTWMMKMGGLPIFSDTPQNHDSLKKHIWSLVANQYGRTGIVEWWPEELDVFDSRLKHGAWNWCPTPTIDGKFATWWWRDGISFIHIFLTAFARYLKPWWLHAPSRLAAGSNDLPIAMDSSGPPCMDCHGLEYSTFSWANTHSGSVCMPY